MLSGICATVPDVYIRAAVSPTIRPIARMTPARTPGIADGKDDAEHGTQLASAQSEASFTVGIRHGFQGLLCMFS